MGRPKGSKNKKSSEQDSPSKSSPPRSKEFSWSQDNGSSLHSGQGNSIDTPKHYYSMQTPRSMQQYTLPPGMSQRFDQPEVGGSNFRHEHQHLEQSENAMKHRAFVGEENENQRFDPNTVRHPGLTKVMSNPQFNQADQTESDD